MNKTTISWIAMAGMALWSTAAIGDSLIIDTTTPNWGFETGFEGDAAASLPSASVMVGESETRISLTPPKARSRRSTSVRLVYGAPSIKVPSSCSTEKRTTAEAG